MGFFWLQYERVLEPCYISGKCWILYLSSNPLEQKVVLEADRALVELGVLKDYPMDSIVSEIQGINPQETMIVQSNLRVPLVQPQAFFPPQEQVFEQTMAMTTAMGNFDPMMMDMSFGSEVPAFENPSAGAAPSPPITAYFPVA